MKKTIALLAVIILLVVFTAEAGRIMPEEMPEGIWSCGWYTVQIRENRISLLHDEELLQETEFRMQNGRLKPITDWFCEKYSL